MQLTLATSHGPLPDGIDAAREMAAYEALWKNPSATMQKIAAFFARHPGQRPSALVSAEEIASYSRLLPGLVAPLAPGILLHGMAPYPRRLRDAEHPVELLYYHGDLGLLQTRAVTVVGTRHPTAEGLARTARLVKHLVGDGITIISGLAAGIDAAAHRAALENNGRTIGTIGTPLNRVYPRQHTDLQAQIARDHLLISPVPYWRYNQQDYRQNSTFFPERNKVSAALGEASIIMEAGDASGTLGLARAALYQKRKLLLPDSLFADPALRWPRQYEKLGGIRVKTYDDVRQALAL